MITRALLACLLALSVSCSMPVQPGSEQTTISGTVVYRERIAVPPEAEVQVVLLDVSRMDVAATLIAETRFPAINGPPFEFVIAFDPEQIQPRMRYSLRATIRLDDKLLFTSTSALDPFAGDDREILVSKVGGERR